MQHCTLQVFEQCETLHIHNNDNLPSQKTNLVHAGYEFTAEPNKVPWEAAKHHR